MASISITPQRTRIPRPRALGILVAAVVLVGLTYGWTATRPATAPRPPTGDPATIDIATGTAAGLTPGSIAQLDHSINAWAGNLSAEPRDFISATSLAALYYTRGRLSGDLADDQRALEAARMASRMAPTEPGGRAIEAAVLYTIHDFSGALAVAEALYRDDPSQVGALATIADSKLELGRIDDARSDFDLLATLARGPSVDVRLARLASVTGRPDEALRLAIAARDAAETNSAMAAVDVGFYEYAVGEYARLAGKAATARSAYQAALAIRDTDFGALVGLARIDAFDGRLGEALAGLRKAAAIAPQPETVALLGDLLAASGDATGAKEQYSTVRFIERLGQIQSTVFDRVLIRFELDHAGASEDELAAARASLAARPDTTGHDAVAWALYRLGRLDEAAIEIKAARVNGADDARLRFHDGAIALARGDRAAGQALLRSALASGPALDPIERAEATHLSTR
jgi:tetratricopeptide (TPR) repeat protein